MSYLFYSAASLLLLFYFGIGLTLLISPWRRYAVLLAPTIGYCLITLVGWYGYQWSGSGTDRYAWWCLSVPTVLLAIAVWRRFQQSTEQGGDDDLLWSRELLAPMVAGTIAFFISSTLLLSNDDPLTSLALTNNDIADSATITTFLKTHGRDYHTGWLAQCDFCRVMGDRGIFGGSESTAFMASMLSLDPFQVQSMSLHIHFLVSVLVLYVVGQQLLGFAHVGAVVVCLLYAVNPIMMFTVCQGYQGQILTTGIVMFIVLVHARPMRVNSLRECLPLVPLAVLLNWGLSVTYPHMLLFAHAPLVPYCLFVVWRQRSLAAFFRAWAFGIAVFTVLLILSPYRAWGAYHYLKDMGGVVAGWFIPWLTPDVFLGFHLGGVLERPDPWLYRVTVSLALIVTAAWGLLRLRKANRDQFEMALSILLVVGSGSLLLAISERRGAQLGGYKSYKLLSYFLPLVMLAAWTIFRDRMSWRSLARAPALMSILALALVSNLISDRGIFTRYPVRYVSPRLAGVVPLNERPDIQAVNLVEREHWQSLWQACCLPGKTLYFGQTTYAGRVAGPYLAPCDLVRIEPHRRPPEYFRELVRDTRDVALQAEGAALNEEFRLVPRRRWESKWPFPVEVRGFDERNGWSRVNAEYVAFDPTAGTARLHVEVWNDTPAQLRLAFRKQGVLPGLRVMVNYRQVQPFENPEVYFADLELKRGGNLIELAPAQPLAQSTAPDGTTARYEFSVVEVAIPAASSLLVGQRGTSLR